MCIHQYPISIVCICAWVVSGDKITLDYTAVIKIEPHRKNTIMSEKRKSPEKKIVKIDNRTHHGLQENVDTGQWVMSMGNQK